MRKFNLFNFLEKKISTAEISTVTADMLEQIAFKELALFIGTSYIANTLSKCEFKTYKGNKEVKEKLYYMLNISPNPNQNSSQFINKFVEQYFYKGSALLVPNNDYLYCADSFDIDDSNPLKEYIFSNVSFNQQQLKKKYKASEVFYMQLDNKDVKNLVDSLYVQYSEIISLAISAYKKANGRKYKLMLEQYRAGDPQFVQAWESTIKNQLKAFIENDNAVYPQFKGTDLEEFTTTNGSSKDATDIISMRKEIFDVVAQALKIPLPMMYGNITNIDEIVRVYLSFCIDPLADMISEELTRKYYSYEEWKKGDFVKVDTSCIKHTDILEVANEIYNAVGSGVVNIDDIRKRLNMNELGTDFSRQFFTTKNFVKIEDMLNNSSDIQKGGEGTDEA